MDNRTPCPICRTPNISYASAGANTSEINCPRCGRYQIQAFAETQLHNSPPAFPPAHLLSGLCRNTWDHLGEKVLITVDLFKSWADLERVAKLPVPRDTDVVTKGEYLLKHLRRRSKTLADRVSFTPHELACGFCSTKNELLFCLRYLADRGWVEECSAANRKGPPRDAITFRLTPAGWAALAAPATPAQPRAVVSVMLDREDESLWTQGFAAAAQAAGYVAERVENREQLNKINDELIVSLRRAAFVIADLTGQAPMTYFVAGFAGGLGKPVFWTCEESEARDKRLWLETRQSIITTWTRDKPEVFAARFAQRIEATIPGE